MMVCLHNFEFKKCVNEKHFASYERWLRHAKIEFWLISGGELEIYFFVQFELFIFIWLLPHFYAFKIRMFFIEMKSKPICARRT